MKVPDDLLYTEDHEWIRVEGTKGRLGISDFAQEQLGDIVFVELPAVGARLEAKATMGVVESVKSMSDLYAPVGGTVLAVNEKLKDHPELVNEDPYGEGWMLEIEAEEPKGLLSPADYRNLTHPDGP